MNENKCECTNCEHQEETIDTTVTQATMVSEQEHGNLYNWAKSELDMLGEDEDEMQKLMNSQLLELLAVFETHGHSGFSASYAISCLERLLRWKPLKPLTGEDDEWNLVADNPPVWQNRRCSSVFKKEDGSCHDNDAYVYSDDNGKSWSHTGRYRDQEKPITFPYTPPIKPERILVDKL